MSNAHLGTGRSGEAPSAHDAVDLGTVFTILRRQWFVVFVFLAVFGGLAVAYATVMPKTWRASARVMLDPRDKQIVGNDVNRPQQSVELGWVETRVELVKAFGTLANVVKSQNLTEDTEILSEKEAAAAADKVTAAVRNLAEMLIVERPKENNLVDVTISSKSPEKAARLANAVAQSFVDVLVSAKVEQIEHANDLLSKQVDDMRRKMLEAEARVEEYKRANGIAVTRGNLVDEETLRQSNENLVTARLKTQEARERFERLRQVMKSGDPTIASQTDSIGSAVLSRLKIEAAMASRRKTELEQNLGPRHPRVQSAAAEVERARAQVVEEIKSLAATAELDYQIARANEDNVRKAVERAQARLADTSQAVVGLQELENEANARRDLYKSFVSRMEETTLQKTTQVSDGRLVSPAQVPLRHHSPRLSLALALALVTGLGLGVSVALWRGRHQVAAPRHPPSDRPDAVPPVVDAPPSADAPVVEPRREAVAPAPVVAPVPPSIEPVAPAQPVAAPLASAPEASPAEAPAPATAAPSGPARPAPTRVDLRLTRERLARLDEPDGPGRGPTAALVETADGRLDQEAIADLRRTVQALGDGEQTGIRVVFSTGVATATTAGLAYGLARLARDARRRVLLVDLAHEEEVLDPAFELGELIPEVGADADDEFEQVRAPDGMALARPLDPVVEGDPEGWPEGLADFLDRTRPLFDTVLVHLGRAPVAALLFDIADAVDHMTLVVDERDLAGRRTTEEIDVMAGLLPHFDGLLVVSTVVAEGEAAIREPRRRRARV